MYDIFRMLHSHEWLTCISASFSPPDIFIVHVVGLSISKAVLELFCLIVWADIRLVVGLPQSVGFLCLVLQGLIGSIQFKICLSPFSSFLQHQFLSTVQFTILFDSQPFFIFLCSKHCYHALISFQIHWNLAAKNLDFNT